jgi:hypothetical protein
MTETGTDPKIHLAFRFHANFSHSYRGDTDDERGFGMDIRIIRNTIEVLDDFNARGIPARATWDIENYFSLETIMRRHCPDIIESLQRRVAEGRDEVQVMSYNNGLISAHTAVEFDEAIARAITNPAGSGLRDLFAEFGPMVRPQEMMYTPLHLKMYPKHGIESISLFYSAVPFNAFSCFVSPPPFEQQYNPMTLTYPGIEETMTLVPARNHGDIVDNISLRWWLKRLRRRQLALAKPVDLLLLIDADADDEYWYGYPWPVVSQLLAAARGIRGLIESVCDLDYLVFATPSEYVRTHSPVGEVTIRQDTADGSFDGLSSWAEKWSNHWLWTGIERSRVLELQTRRLAEVPDGAETEGEIGELIRESREARLKALSTTHFGLSAPIVNRSRLSAAAKLVGESVERAAQAYDHVVAGVAGVSEGTGESVGLTLFDYVRGISTDCVRYEGKPSRALVRLPLRVPDPQAVGASLSDAHGALHPIAIRSDAAAEAPANAEALFVVHMAAGERKDLRLDLVSTGAQELRPEGPVSVGAEGIESDLLRLRFDAAMRPVGLSCSGVELADGELMRSAITYAGRRAEASPWAIAEQGVLGSGLVGFIRLQSAISFDAGGEKRVELEREFLLAAGLPYLYVSTRAVYPETRSRRFNSERALRLEREYDANWREVMPCEIRPALFGRRGSPLRVWKHNFLDQVSHYDLDYGEFSANDPIDSFNNHITCAWVAVTDGEKGLLVAQSADVNSCLAFCPMRTRATPAGTRILLNPFGAYDGKQLRYPTAFSGLGRNLALVMSDHLETLAPSYNGRSEIFSQLLAPYVGDEPPRQLRCDAEAFAYPYAVVSPSPIIRPPAHRSWSDRDGG